MKGAIEIDIPLGARAHKAVVGAGLLSRAGQYFRALNLGTRAVVVTDSNVGPRYAETVSKSLREAGFRPEVLTVPAGEASKGIARAELLCRRMIQAGCDRQTYVVALGGGVVGDLAGFVAGIFCRGIPYVQLPTTIVAQVDSSLGGKTGVNIEEGKNLIGVFHQPRLILADTATLETLPRREFNEGFAEIIKHAAIRDAEMVPLIEAVLGGDRERLAELVARNIAIKAKIIVEDERETAGTRALLNFGHTIGHAIEAAAGYGRFLHGEAISLGLIAAARLSERRGGLPPEDVEKVTALLRGFDLPETLPHDIDTEAVMTCLRRDKKFVEGKVRFVLLRRLGEAFVSGELDEGQIRNAIEGLRP